MELVAEQVRKIAWDRVELAGIALLTTYVVLALGMYLQYVSPA